MYTKIIKFRNLTKNNDLEKLLSEIPPRQNFMHVFNIGIGDEDLALKDDVFFVPSSDIRQLKRVHEIKKKDEAKVIIIASEAQTISDELWTLADDVWRIGADNSFSEIRARYQHLLDDFETERELKLKSIYLESVIDASSSLIWFKDIKGVHVDINEEFCRAVNKTKDQIRGRGHYYIWDLKEEEYQKGEYVCLETDEEVTNSAKRGVFDETVKTKLGLRKFKTVKAPLFAEDGSVMGTVGIASDVTDILNLSSEMQSVLDRIPLGLLLVDQKRITRNINLGFTKIFNHDFKQFLNQTVDNIKGFLSSEGWHFKGINKDYEEMFLEDEKGLSRFLSVSLTTTTDVFGKRLGKIIVFEDITKQKLSAKRLKTEANTDILTGLYNRRYYETSVHSIYKNSSSDAFIYIDLNRFKELNDIYGHDAGDRALAKIGNLLREHFDNVENCVIIRMGGDEFVVYIYSKPEELVQEKALSLEQNIYKKFAKEKSMTGLTASIGVAYCADKSMSIDELLKSADKMMYVKKKNYRETLEK